MAFKEQIVELVLRARDSMSKGTNAAAKSVEELAGNAEGLQDKLKVLEDQGTLIRQFTNASKAVDKAASSYEKAQAQTTRLGEKIEATAGVARRQAVEFELAQKAVGSAETDYRRAEATLASLADEIARTGVATEDQAKEFERASKLVDRTGTAYQKAELRLDALSDKMDRTANLTDRQAKEFEDAQKAVAAAEREYKRAEGTLGTLANEAQAAGIDIGNLGEAQKENSRETAKAARALEDYNTELDDGNTKLGSFRERLSSGVGVFAAWGAAAAAAGAALAVGTLARFTASQADLARQTLASANAFGISVEALQTWQAASRQVGIEGDKVADIMKDVAEKIGDAYLTGGGEARDVIQGLGLDIEKLINLSPDEQILAIARELDGMPKAGQIQILEALASDASLLLPLLDNNAAKLREFGEIAAARNQIFTKEELEQLAEVNKTFGRITAQVSTFAKRVAISLAPAFNEAGEAIDKALADTPELLDKITGFLTTLVTKFTDFATNVVDEGSAVRNTITSIIETAKGIANVFEAGFRGVQAFAAGSLEVIARTAFSIQSLITKTTRGLNQIGIASDESVQAAEARLANLGLVVQDLEAQANSYKQQMKDAGSSAVTAFGAASDAAENAAASTAQAAASALKLDTASKKVDETIKKQAVNQQELSRQIIATAEAAEAAFAVWQQDPTEENLQKYQALKAALAELQESLRNTDLNLPDPPDTSDVKDYVDNLKNAGDETQKVGQESERTYKQVVILGEKSKETGEQMEEAGSKGSAAFAVLSGAISGYLQQMAQLSVQARDQFISFASGTKVATASTDELTSRIGELDTRLQELRFNNLRTVDATGLQGVLNKLGTSAALVEKQFLQQKLALRDLGTAYDEGRIKTVNFISSTENALRSATLLDEQTLSQFRGAIDQARAAMESLRDETQGTVSTLQDELDRLQGNTAAIEERRFQEQIRDLQDRLELAQRTGDAESIANAKEALALAQQIKSVKDEEIRAAQAERAAQQRDRQVQSQSRTTTTSSPTRDGGTVTLNLQSGGQPVGTLSGVDAGEAQQLLDALQRAGLSVAG
jgi:hypothetical protein